MKFKKLFIDEDVDFNSEDSIHLYTDGSALGNGQINAPCGWAYVIRQGDTENHMSGGCIGSTNNQMEMTAVLKGLKACNSNFPVTVYSDSKYVIETLKGNFNINKNQDLWNQLKSEINRFKHIQFTWVKGHADDYYNNLVDHLANDEAKKRLN